MYLLVRGELAKSGDSLVFGKFKESRASNAVYAFNRQVLGVDVVTLFQRDETGLKPSVATLAL